MLKLKLDENFSPQLSSLFESAGFDTETVLSEQLSGASDDVLFEKIKAEKRCMVTLDLDFANILRYPTNGTAGIIIIRPYRPITLEVMELFSRQLIAELQNSNPENCLWILESNRLRIRRPEE